MYRITSKFAILSLAAYFAVLSSGSALLHQVVGDRSCGCHSHRHSVSAVGAAMNAGSGLNDACCSCAEHSRPADVIQQAENSPSAGDSKACLLCHFFGQSVRVDNVSIEFEYAAALGEKTCFTSSSALGNLPQAKLARGPPATV
jgi:hypothetical protein